MDALRPYPVGEREPADLGLAQPEQAHDVETGIPELRQVASHPFSFLSHSLVNLGFREALGGIGFDTGYRVAHTEIVKSPVGIIVFLAYLSHRIKVASGTLFVRERVAHGLLVVSRRNELPFRAALRFLLSLLLGKVFFGVRCIFVHLLFCLFTLPGED